MIHIPEHIRSLPPTLGLPLYGNFHKYRYKDGRNSKRQEPYQAGSPAEAALRIKPQHQPQVTNRQRDGQRLCQDDDE